jgi:hypothetical protein
MADPFLFFSSRELKRRLDRRVLPEDQSSADELARFREGGPIESKYNLWKELAPVYSTREACPGAM